MCLHPLISPIKRKSTAIRRPKFRSLIRLPKHLLLYPRSLKARNHSRAERKVRPYISHVGIVPDQKAVFVAFAEAGCREAEVDTYAAVVCKVFGVSSCDASTGGCRGDLLGKMVLSAVGDM